MRANWERGCPQYEFKLGYKHFDDPPCLLSHIAKGTRHIALYNHLSMNNNALYSASPPLPLNVGADTAPFLCNKEAWSLIAEYEAFY